MFWCVRQACHVISGGTKHSQGTMFNTCILYHLKDSGKSFLAMKYYAIIYIYVYIYIYIYVYIWYSFGYTMRAVTYYDFVKTFLSNPSMKHLINHISRCVVSLGYLQEHTLVLTCISLNLVRMHRYMGCLSLFSPGIDGFSINSAKRGFIE